MNKPQSKSWYTVLWKALSLQENLYEETRSTPQAHRSALAIVILAAISHGLGGIVILLLNRADLPLLILAFGVDTLSVIGGYYFWTFTTLKVGRWLKPVGPSYGDLLSPIGFAYAPQVLNVLTLIPLLGRPIELVLAVWSLLAVTIAVREALDIRTRKAVLICLVGWPLIQVSIGFIQVAMQSLT